MWSFVGGKGLASDIDHDVDEEQALIPDYEAARLLLHFPQVQAEMAERIGDFDLDPADSGVVRRIGIRILDLAKGDKAIKQVNPARWGGRGLAIRTGLSSGCRYLGPTGFLEATGGRNDRTERVLRVSPPGGAARPRAHPRPHCRHQSSQQYVTGEPCLRGT